MSRNCRVLPLLILASLAGCSVALALTQAQVGQLVFVEQSELPRLVVDRAVFLPDGHVAVGGWFEWPGSPVVAIFPNDLQAMQIGTQAASPRFAVSPDGKTIAFWKRVKVGQQDRGDLNLVRLDGQMVTTLGEPIPISDSMHLAWLPANGPLVYSTEDPQRPVGVLYALDLTGGKPRKVLELHQGQWRDLQPGSAAGTVLAHWGATETAVYSVNCLPGATTTPQPAALTLPSPDGTGKTLELDAQGQLVLGVSATEGVVVDREVRCARWRPDGQAILYAKDRQLFVVGQNGTEPRLLVEVTAQDPNLYLRGCAWSPDGNSLVYWGASGASGRAWRASLGLERLTARFTFPREAPVKADNRLWVVTKFQKDAFGNIVEPVWNTLKAMFVVTRILRTPEGVIAEAINSGGQAGTAERLAGEALSTQPPGGHISIGVAGQPPATWSRTSTFKFRSGLVGWLEKTKYIGQPGTLTLERQILGAEE